MRAKFITVIFLIILSILSYLFIKTFLDIAYNIMLIIIVISFSYVYIIKGILPFLSYINDNMFSQHFDFTPFKTIRTYRVIYIYLIFGIISAFIFYHFVNTPVNYNKHNSFKYSIYFVSFLFTMYILYKTLNKVVSEDNVIEYIDIENTLEIEQIEEIQVSNISSITENDNSNNEVESITKNVSKILVHNSILKKIHKHFKSKNIFLEEIDFEDFKSRFLNSKIRVNLDCKSLYYFHKKLTEANVKISLKEFITFFTNEEGEEYKYNSVRNGTNNPNPKLKEIINKIFK